MCLLAAALVFTATLRRRVAVADEGRLPSWVPRAVGAVSLALWMGVTISGRLITFYVLDSGRSCHDASVFTRCRPRP